MLELLRAATRARHADLGASAAMVRLFEPTYTLAEYRAHLGRMLGLFEALEDAALRGATPADPAPPHRRSIDLREDLLRMGIDDAAIAKFEPCRTVTDFPAGGMRGYTYVMLGSMLGGRLVVKHLTSVLGASASLLFYGAGASGAIALWESFCTDLASAPLADARVICDTATAIFDAYANWLSAPLDAPVNR